MTELQVVSNGVDMQVGVSNYTAFEKSTIRPIFERFQNLNLLTLIHDLRADQVMRGDWDSKGSSYQSCPIAHGWFCGFEEMSQRRMEENKPPLSEVGLAQVSESIGQDFIFWWDTYEDDGTLLSTLEKILAERFADADAYQQVMEGEDNGNRGIDQAHFQPVRELEPAYADS